MVEDDFRFSRGWVHDNGQRGNVAEFGGFLVGNVTRELFKPGQVAQGRISLECGERLVITIILQECLRHHEPCKAEQFHVLVPFRDVHCLQKAAQSFHFVPFLSGIFALPGAADADVLAVRQLKGVAGRLI